MHLFAGMHLGKLEGVKIGITFFLNHRLLLEESARLQSNILYYLYIYIERELSI